MCDGCMMVWILYLCVLIFSKQQHFFLTIYSFIIMATGIVQFSIENYQEAAVKSRSELLMLPIIGSKETLDHMTGRPGIRYKERVGSAAFSAQFAPYNASRRQNSNLKITYRDLETHLGSVVADFEPNSAVSSILGQGATKGDGQAVTPTAEMVLALMGKSLSYNLNQAIWNGEYNANGTTTHDLFDGFDTITDKEIAAGNISNANGNLLELNLEITADNAYEVFRQILKKIAPELRARKAYIYCSQDVVDAYNESYLKTHGGVMYNRKFEQTSVEGSNGNLVFVPLANKADSKYIHISTKENMLYGYDTMSDEAQILVKEYAPFVLSYVATMFFGVQFESIDKRVLTVVKLAEPAAAEEPASDSENAGDGE